MKGILKLYREAFAGLPRDVWMLSLASLVNRAGTMVLPFAALYLTGERGFTIAEAGRMLSVYGVGSILGSYLGGWSSDRLGPIRTLHLSLITTGVAFLWFPMLQSWKGIALGMLVISVVGESFRPAVMTAMGQAAPANLQARSYALLRLAVNLGWGVGPAVAGVLALHDYTWLFIGDAVTCWAASVFLLLGLRERASAFRPEPGPVGSRPRSPWSDGPFLFLLLLLIFLATVVFQSFSTLPLQFKAYGFREDAIGVLMGFNALLIVLFEMVLIHWVEKKDRYVTIAIGAVLTYLGFAVLPLGSSMAFAAFSVAIWTVGEMLTLPLTNVLVAERSDPQSRGRYMGLYTAAFSFAFVFAPAAGTYIFQSLGPQWLWYGIGVLALPIGGAFLALRRMSRGEKA